MRAKDKKWLLLLLILSGLVVGGLIGSMLVAYNPGFAWLDYGERFGLSTPITLDLKVIKLTFGFQINITISSIIGMLAGILAYTQIK